MKRTAWDLALEMIVKDKEQMDLGKLITEETNETKLRAYRTRMEKVDQEFLEIKHKLQDIEV